MIKKLLFLTALCNAQNLIASTPFQLPSDTSSPTIATTDNSIPPNGIELNGYTFTFGSSNTNETYNGIISDLGRLVGVNTVYGSLSKTGTGITTLTANNTYTGATTVTAGTLNISKANASSGFAVSSGATLGFNGSSAQTFSGVISGAGSVTQSGTGTTTLSGENTYTGATTVSDGTLNISGADNNSSAYTVSGGTLSYSPTAATTYSEGITNNATVSLGGNATLSGVISGSGSVVNAVGTNTLTGNNTYTGATTVTAGTLNISKANASSGFAVSSGATLGLSPSSSQSYSNVRGAGNVSTNNNATINYTGSSAQTFSGVISGAGSVTQSGTGTTTLSGANTYTGTTTVRDGTLEVSGSGSISNNIVIGSNGTLDYASNSNPSSISSLKFIASGGESSTADKLTIGTISNQSSSALSLPSTINVVSDGTVLTIDGSANPIGTTWTLVNGSHRGSPSVTIDPALTLGGSVAYALDTTTANKLNLKVTGNYFDSANTIHNISNAQESLIALIDSRYAASTDSMLYQEASASAFKSIVSNMNTFYNFASSKNSSTPGNVLSIERVSLKSKDSPFGMWVGFMASQGNNKAVNNTPASKDNQMGPLVGVEYRNENAERYVGALFGYTVGKSELKNESSNNSKNKTSMLGAYFSQGFGIKEFKNFEVDINLTAAKSKSEAERLAFDLNNNKVNMKSDIDATTFYETATVAYKLKWKKEDGKSTSFSLKPYLGLTGMQFKRDGFSENGDANLSMTRPSMNYNTYGGIVGLGIRKRFDFEGGKSLKVTGDIQTTNLFNSPKIEDVVYIKGENGLKGIPVKSEDLTKTTISPSLTVQYGSHDFKVSAKASAFIQKNRNSYALMLRASYFF